jgi:hypothetical protein
MIHRKRKQQKCCLYKEPSSYQLLLNNPNPQGKVQYQPQFGFWDNDQSKL